MPNPFTHPELYQAMILGGKRSPGVVTFSGHDRDIGWDIKKGPGQKGATTTRTSEDPVEFEASFYLVTDPAREVDDVAAWPEFLDIVKSTIAGPEPKALDAYHPDLAEVDIKSVVLKKILGVTRDGHGGETRKIRFLEYRPAKAQGGSGTPNGSRTKPTKATQKDDPNAAALAELAKLTEEYKRTPWQ